MPVAIANHYTDRSAKDRCQLSIRSVRIIAEKVQRHLGVSDYNVNIVLTDDDEIRQLNATYRHRDSPTNVLSFPFAEGAEQNLQALPVRELGDIIISVDTAEKESNMYNQQLMYRLGWLIIHGFLHLLGHDHERSSEAAREMEIFEQHLLTQVFSKRSRQMIQLAINVDHVATIRQARGGSEPDPVFAASLCEQAGASGIVVHLREDRRHIQDRDVYLLRKTIKTRLNLEMAANKEIVDIALDVGPDMITLVPEKRQELTTEGGLDVISQKKKLAKTVKKFDKAGIPVSIFVDPDADQIQASHDIGARFVEIHTGRYCDATSEDQRDAEFDLVAAAAEEASQRGLMVNGGHGLNYYNTGRIASLETLEELSIGHAIISRAVFTGIEQAVKDMLQIIHTSRQHLF